MTKYLPIIFLLILVACNNNNSDDFVDNTVKPKPTPQIAYTIVASYPHDTSAYTQGLEFHNGKLFEGTGDYETSSLRITDFKSGAVEKIHHMGTADIFGEGITIFKNKIYQLTWQNNLVYVYDPKDINKPITTFKWPYQGWGLTHNETDLIISDGTANLYFVDPENFKLKNTISVSDNSGPIDSINELEYVDGFIYANIYETNTIIKIDPSSGHVIGRIDFPDLKQKFFAGENIPGRTDVLNGIAYDSSRKSLFITGKRWPKMFELKIN